MPKDLPYAYEIIKVLLARHRHGGSPLPKDAVISMAAVPSHGLGDAKDTFEELRTSEEYPFVENHGRSFVRLNNSEFFGLVEFLYHECDVPPEDIQDNLRHYEGWDQHAFF